MHPKLKAKTIRAAGTGMWEEGYAQVAKPSSSTISNAAINKNVKRLDPNQVTPRAMTGYRT
ncbi:hypothetical protein ARTHROSP310_03290 [Arthrobacter sp. AD-310]